MILVEGFPRTKDQLEEFNQWVSRLHELKYKHFIKYKVIFHIKQHDDDNINDAIITIWLSFFQFWMVIL